jgi:hypothetical protein
LLGNRLAATSASDSAAAHAAALKDQMREFDKKDAKVRARAELRVAAVLFV